MVYYTGNLDFVYFPRDYFPVSYFPGLVPLDTTEVSFTLKIQTQSEKKLGINRESEATLKINRQLEFKLER